MNTICWKCRHSVPKVRKGKYISGCSWSLRKIPVLGWEAEKKEYKAMSGRRIVSYCVQSCPEYDEERPSE